MPGGKGSGERKLKKFGARQIRGQGLDPLLLKRLPSSRFFTGCSGTKKIDLSQKTQHGVKKKGEKGEGNQEECGEKREGGAEGKHEQMSSNGRRCFHHVGLYCSPRT